MFTYFEPEDSISTWHNSEYYYTDSEQSYVDSLLTTGHE